MLPRIYFYEGEGNAEGPVFGLVPNERRHTPIASNPEIPDGASTSSSKLTLLRALGNVPLRTTALLERETYAIPGTQPECLRVEVLNCLFRDTQQCLSCFAD
jgi:hypothetical protein